MVAIAALASSAAAQKSASVSLSIAEYVRVATTSSGTGSTNAVGITTNVVNSGGTLSISEDSVISVYVWSNTGYRLTANLDGGAIQGGNSRSIWCDCFFTDSDSPGSLYSSPLSHITMADSKIFGVRLVPTGNLSDPEDDDSGTYVGTITVDISVST